MNEDLTKGGYLGLLPSDILGKEVCSYLNYFDVKALQGTCKFFRASSVLETERKQKTLGWQIFPTICNVIVLSPDGHAFGIGSNVHSRLGVDDDDTVNKFFPIYLPTHLPITKIVAGDEQTFFFDTNNDCFYSGKAIRFNNSLEKYPKTSTPISLILPNGNKVADVAMGRYDSVFLMDAQKNCFAYGRNNMNQLGFKNPTWQHPLELLTLPNKKKIIKIVPGGQHSFILDEDSQWYGMGINFCAFSTVNKEPTPIHLEDQQIVDIKVGDSHCFFKTAEGKYYGLGYNDYGQLGCKDIKIYSTPIEITLQDETPIVEIKTIGNHTFFKNNEMKWFASGYNEYGQLGCSITDKDYDHFKNALHLPTPVKLPNNKKIRKITSDYSKTFFYDVDGNIFGVGCNESIRKLGILAHNLTCINDVLNKLENIYQTKEIPSKRPRL